MPEADNHNDHDLLIRLDTIMGIVHKKIDNFLALVEEKADKTDLVSLDAKHEEIHKRVLSLEQARQLDKVQEKTKRDVYVNLGNFGWKTWAVIVAVVGIVISLLKK